MSPTTMVFWHVSLAVLGVLLLASDLWAGQPLWGEASRKTCVEVNDSLKVEGWLPQSRCKDVKAYYFVPVGGCAQAKPFSKEEGLAAIAVEATKSLDFEGSYRSLAGEIRGYSSSCNRDLEKIYRKGGDLSDPEITKAIVPLRAIKTRSGNINASFFHYFSSGSTNFINVLKAKDLGKIFSYLKRKHIPWGHPFYVAEDPLTSAYRGNTAAVLSLNLDGNAIRQDRKLFQEAMTRVLDRHPELKACGHWSSHKFYDKYESVQTHKLLFNMLEDSGVEVVDYTKGGWFQILSPNIVQDVSISYRSPAREPR